MWILPPPLTGSEMLLTEEDFVCSHDTGDGKVQVISRSAGSFIFPSTALLPAGESLYQDYNRFTFICVVFSNTLISLWLKVRF